MVEEFVEKYLKWIYNEMTMLSANLASETFPVQWVPNLRAKMAQLIAAKVEIERLLKAYAESEDEFYD